MGAAATISPSQASRPAWSRPSRRTLRGRLKFLCADIAEAAAAILTHAAAHAGAVYTLTGSEALTDAQIAATIGRAVGCDIKYVDVPEQTAVDATTGMGYPPPVIDWLTSLNYVIKQGWAAGVSSDVQTLTGHPPRRFEDFAREHAVARR